MSSAISPSPLPRTMPEIVVASNRGRWKEKIAIIGGGPAGLSCAYYLACMGYYPTVFEKNEEPGGMLRYGIPSYKLEKKVIEAEIDIMREIGVEIRTGVEVGKDISLDELRAEGYKGFYVAIGCQGGRLPGIEGDRLEGTTTAIEFLHKANCGQLRLEGKVVVVGGGNVAIDAARVAMRSGAESVKMLSLESEDIMPATPFARKFLRRTEKPRGIFTMSATESACFHSAEVLVRSALTRRWRI